MRVVTGPAGRLSRLSPARPASDARPRDHSRLSVSAKACRYAPTGPVPNVIHGCDRPYSGDMPKQLRITSGEFDCGCGNFVCTRRSYSSRKRGGAWARASGKCRIAAIRVRPIRQEGKATAPARLLALRNP